MGTGDRTGIPAIASLPVERKGFSMALNLFHQAAERVPAYKKFLKKMRVRPELIRTKSDFDQIPLIDKLNYVSVYSLEEMSWDGTLDTARYVSTSSGSTGVPYFWPRGVAQDVIVGSIMRKVHEDIFDSKSGSTLFVDSFALGTWIAGLEFYNAARWTADAGSKIVIATPGIDKAEAIHQIKRLANSFSRVVLGGYPPFIKDIIEQGTISGIVWKDIDMRLLFAGEAVSEFWRDRVLELVGKKNDYFASVNVYGMADIGAVAHDTPLSCLVRRHLPILRDNEIPATSEVLGMYQYDPTVRYFQVVGESSVVITANSGLPLIRYDTRDSGGILGRDAMLERMPAAFFSDAKKHKISLGSWKLPFIYLHGRKDLSISLYALNIYVENIKHSLEHSSHNNLLSGLFTMQIGHTENLDQQFQLTIELARDSQPSEALIESLTKEIVASLCKLNSEYAKLYSVIGARALPRITLIRYGEMETIPGRKHKWVKRS
jgi:phenylacetate-CoA ligase